MGKEKVIEKTTEEITNKSNVIMQYLPIIIGLICLVVCYLLFKKFQTLNAQSSSIENIEKQFTGFIKEQSEINSFNSKRFNALISQINQVNYVLQNNNTRETNTVTSQMSPDRDNIKQEQNLQQQSQPQREMMPTSVIQTNFPINGQENRLPVPINTSNKKENENNVQNFPRKMKETKLNKKIIDLEKEEEKNNTVIEEIESSDENE